MADATPLDAAAPAGPAARAARAGAFWWSAAALALVGGYADLWRGGETVAPILLVLGYCVLVPIAILK